MSLNEDQATPGKKGARNAQLMIAAAAAVVFAVMVAAGALAVGYAIPGFAVLTLVGLLALRAGEDSRRQPRPAAILEEVNDPLGVIVAGMPDPVIAADR